MTRPGANRSLVIVPRRLVPNFSTRSLMAGRVRFLSEENRMPRNGHDEGRTCGGNGRRIW